MAQHSVTLYGLSTCVHCKHAREYMEKHSVLFNCVYVDRLEGEERASTLAEVRKHNPRVSFPTIVLDGGVCVLVGFKEDELSKALGVS